MAMHRALDSHAHPLPALCFDRQRRLLSRSAASRCRADVSLAALYHAAAEAKQFRFMHLDACAWRLQSTTLASSRCRREQRSRVRVLTRAFRIRHTRTGHGSSAFIAHLHRTSMAKRVHSWAWRADVAWLPTLPSAFPGRRGLGPGAPLSSLLLSGAPQPLRHRAVNSSPSFVQTRVLPRLHKVHSPKKSAWATRLLQFDLHCPRRHVHWDGHGLVQTKPGQASECGNTSSFPSGLHTVSGPPQ
jgi:hypothetical protein